MGEVATAAGVPFKGVATVSEMPYMGIIETAKKHKCDAIFMDSHGRSDVAGLVLGSVTQNVLVHTKLPVLACR
jgi:nucleotide-binding universal stress UspA family protein